MLNENQSITLTQPSEGTVGLLSKTGVMQIARLQGSQDPQGEGDRGRG